jgi:hypothetical protein
MTSSLSTATVLLDTLCVLLLSGTHRVLRFLQSSHGVPWSVDCHILKGSPKSAWAYLPAMVCFSGSCLWTQDPLLSNSSSFPLGWFQYSRPLFSLCRCQQGSRSRMDLDVVNMFVIAGGTLAIPILAFVASFLLWPSALIRIYYW